MTGKPISDRDDRRRRAADARDRFERATLALAAEHRFGGQDSASGEIDMMEEATRLVREAGVDD